MGFFDDTLLIGGGLAFAEHEHHKHQMQRQVLNGYMNNGSNGGQSYAPPPGQPNSLSRGVGASYGQQGGYYQQGYGGQDMITVPRSEWDRLQREAAEGRQQMQRYVDKMEELDRERRELRAQRT